WPTDVVRSFANTTAMMEKVIARGALPVVMGGDHAITYPVARAIREPFHILHFDAHLDYMPFIHDLRFTNGHAFRHLAPLPQVLSLSQIGIRSRRTAGGWMEDSIRDGNKVVTMREFAEMGPEGVAALVPAGARCYVSIDVDGVGLPLGPRCVFGGAQRQG